MHNNLYDFFHSTDGRTAGRTVGRSVLDCIKLLNGFRKKCALQEIKISSSPNQLISHTPKEHLSYFRLHTIIKYHSICICIDRETTNAREHIYQRSLLMSYIQFETGRNTWKWCFELELSTLDQKPSHAASSQANYSFDLAIFHGQIIFRLRTLSLWISRSWMCH